MQLDLTPEFCHALELLERSTRNLFITGRAGTGKSTLLQHFRAETRKNVVVLAPTGVAAVNVGGEPIHSFFGFKPDITPDRVNDPTPGPQHLRARAHRGPRGGRRDRVRDLLDAVA